MMDFENLNNDNIKLYAIKNYENPHCASIKEFEDDFARPRYIKKWIKKYFESGTINERIILNHLIVFYNTFGNKAATRVLFYKMDSDMYPVLKTFLVFLNKLPNVVSGIPETIYLSDVTMDKYVIETLRKI